MIIILIIGFVIFAVNVVCKKHANKRATLFLEFTNFNQSVKSRTATVLSRVVRS